MIDWRSLPRLFRHCVVSVHGKGAGGKNGVNPIIGSMKICRDCLAKAGLLFSTPYGKDVLNNVELTAKGYKKNQEHLKEGFDGDRKDLQFKALFEQIEPMLYELDGPGGIKAPKEPEPDDRNDLEKTKIKGR